MSKTTEQHLDNISDSLYNIANALEALNEHLKQQQTQQNNNAAAISDEINSLTTTVSSVVNTTDFIGKRLTQITDILDSRMKKPTTPRTTKT